MKKMKASEVQPTGAPLSVNPALLIGDINSRFGLRRSRVETLKASILETGGILVPLEVELLENPVNGAKYRITDGHYRHAAVTELLKDYEGLECPIIVKPAGETPIERLKRQTAFNYEREALSPMDVATAARQMMDGGMSRQEIRAVFKRAGGRKGGAKVQDLSNSSLNIYLSFLSFPKDIQKRIHEGVIGVGAAYRLTQKSADKWAEIVDQCEKDREDELKAEDDREDKYLESLKKEDELKVKAEEIRLAAEVAKTKADEAAKLKAEKIEAESVALTVLRQVDPKSVEDKKKAEESFKAAGADAAGAVKAFEDATKDAVKTADKLKKYNEDAETRRKKLEAVRAGVLAKPTKPIGASSIDKAAKQVEGSGKVKLTATDMRKAVEGWALPGTAVKVSQIAQIIVQCFNSDLTPPQAYSEMAKITGESVKKTKK
jgi:hypothetical protein